MVVRGGGEVPFLVQIEQLHLRQGQRAVSSNLFIDGMIPGDLATTLRSQSIGELAAELDEAAVAVAFVRFGSHGEVLDPDVG